MTFIAAKKSSPIAAQSVTLQCTDQLSTCSSTYYTLDGSQPSTTYSQTTLNPNITYGNVGDITIDPKNNQTVYLAGDIGLYKSINGGQSWTDITPAAAPGPEFSRIVIDPSDSLNLLAQGNTPDLGQLFHSVDAGQTWTSVNNQYAWDIVIAPGGTNTVYATNSAGAVKSIDGGKTFSTLFSTLARGDYIALNST